jgi:hypothetical protein
MRSFLEYIEEKQAARDSSLFDSQRKSKLKKPKKPSRKNKK